MSEIARRRSTRALALLSALGQLLAPASARADADDTRPRVVHDAGTALFTVALDFRVAGRRFVYTDALSPNLRDYRLRAAPMPTVSGELYPAAPASIPRLRDLGVTLGYARALGLASETAQGTKVDTTWDSVNAGLRARFRPLAADGAVIGLHGGFVLTRFEFTTKDAALAASAPSVSYKTLRAGVDARIPLARFALLLGASYDGALSAGAVYRRFRAPRLGGVDFGAGIACAITPGLEARFTAQYLRYFYAFHPTPGDAYVAGGALDELVSLGVGAAYTY